MKLRRYSQDWDDLAAEDLYWSILSDPHKRFGGWDVEAFFASGKAEIAASLERARALGLPGARDRALDFGCGAGRLTQALSEEFSDVIGVDISKLMIDEARRIGHSDARFVLNVATDLGIFADSSFDLVYTTNVLQHIPDAATIRSYLAEFVRVLRPGGLLTFQLASGIPLHHRFQPRRRIYRVLRALRVPRRLLFHTLRLQPIAMAALAADQVAATLESAGGRIVAVDSTTVPGGVVSSTYYVTRDGSETE